MCGAGDQGRARERVRGGVADGVDGHVVKEDPLRRGLLFAGTERGAFVSFDAGDRWQPLQRTLPVTSVRDFVVYGNDLIVATHGRGFWVMDDISALRQVTAEVLEAEAWLFKPADAINFIQGDDNGTPFQRDEAQAQNPPDGAFIDFYLNAAAPVTLEILDATGKVLRKWPPDPATARGPAEQPPLGGTPPPRGCRAPHTRDMIYARGGGPPEEIVCPGPRAQEKPRRRAVTQSYGAPAATAATLAGPPAFDLKSNSATRRLFWPGAREISMSLVRRCLSITVLGVAFACEPPSRPADDTVVQVRVTPDSVTLDPAQTQQFVAAGRTLAGDSVAIAVTWSPSAATLTPRR